ncbi:hypothetical protein FHW58_002684 [Duganella sp. 1224]|nr:hypothetical protein [Duganella sp. 1224]
MEDLTPELRQLGRNDEGGNRKSRYSHVEGA